MNGDDGVMDERVNDMRPHTTGAEGSGGPEAADRDPWLEARLQALDPAATDPLYWQRFARQVVVQARPELERRRVMADVSVAGTLSSWARGLVPAVLAAAAVAGFLLLRPVNDSSRMAVRLIGVDELLVDGLVSDPIPAFETLSSDFDVAVAFASEIR